MTRTLVGIQALAVVVSLSVLGTLAWCMAWHGIYSALVVLVVSLLAIAFRQARIVLGLAAAVALAPLVGICLAVPRLTVECEWLQAVREWTCVQKLCGWTRRCAEKAHAFGAKAPTWCQKCWWCLGRPVTRCCTAWACYRESRRLERLRRQRQLRFAAPKGAIVPFLERLFDKLRLFSAGYWIGRLAPRVFHDCGGGHCKCGDDHDRGQERWIEGYVVVGALLAIGLLAVLPHFPWVRGVFWFLPLVCVVVGYRLAEIFVTAWNVHVFDRLRGHSRPASEERQLVLNLVNYGEIVVLFAILWTLLGKGTARCLNSTWEAFEHSLRIATMMAPLEEIASPVDRVLFVSEAAMALMFILFVLVRAVSLMPRRR